MASCYDSYLDILLKKQPTIERTEEWWAAGGQAECRSLDDDTTVVDTFDEER